MLEDYEYLGEMCYLYEDEEEFFRIYNSNAQIIIDDNTTIQTTTEARIIAERDMGDGDNTKRYSSPFDFFDKSKGESSS